MLMSFIYGLVMFQSEIQALWFGYSIKPLFIVCTNCAPESKIIFFFLFHELQ